MKKKIFIFIGLAVMIILIVICKRPSTKTIVKTVVKHVFYSTEGKPVVLDEQTVYSIRQLSDDGVLPSIIAEQHGMTPIMVSRIINSLKSIKNEKIS